MTSWKVYIDGASRGNPGPAGVGVALFYQDKLVLSRCAHIGDATNNQAEYLALVYAAFILSQLKPRTRGLQQVSIVADSELLIKQMRGVYRVKNPALRILHSLANTLLAEFTCTFHHVLREHNSVADELANQGIDTKKPLPAALRTLVERHGFVV